MQRGRFPGSCPAARLPKARLLSDISLRCTHKAITVAGTAPVFHRIPSLPVSPLMGPGITNCAAKVRRSIQTAKKNQTFCAHPPSFGPAKARFPTPRSTFAGPAEACFPAPRGMFASAPRHVCWHSKAYLPTPRSTFAGPAEACLPTLQGMFAGTPKHVCRACRGMFAGAPGHGQAATKELSPDSQRPFCRLPATARIACHDKHPRLPATVQSAPEARPTKRQHTYHNIIRYIP